MPTLVFDEGTGVTRQKLQEAFDRENVDARVFFWPLSSLPMFTSVPENLTAWSVPSRAINLPSYYDISAEELNRVSAVVERLVTNTAAH
jgi:perosamine synthetase